MARAPNGTEQEIWNDVVLPPDPARAMIRPVNLNPPHTLDILLRLPLLPTAYFESLASAFSLARALIWAHPLGIPWR
jgi:hypothetical protein